MKKIMTLLAICLFVSFSLIAQVYTIDTGYAARIRVTTVVGHYKATNRINKAVLNSKTGNISCQLIVKDFNFGTPLIFQATTTVQRFLEGYMECGKYPDITYEGKILNLQEIDFLTDGTYTVQTKGILKAHGISRELITPVTIIVNNSRITVNGKFLLNPADDYKIRAETPSKYRFFSNVEIVFNAGFIKSS